MKPPILSRSGAAFFLAAIGLMSFAASSAVAQDETKLLDTENNKGEIIVFHGPDELHLDPATVIIAVDVYGDDNVDVNGVTFVADKSDDVATGVAEANGVTVTTTAANQIDAWSATTTFVGADQNSADNLATVMESIRWEAAPNPVTIEVEGLVPGSAYEVQLLTNEGRGPTRYRVWDITVEDELVADNISSNGRLNEDEWDETTSAAYRGVFTATAEGTLSIAMAQDQGGDPPGGEDNNPILNAIVIHTAAPAGTEVVHGKQEILDEGDPDGWDLTVFVVNPLLTSEGTDAEGTPDGTVTSWSVAFREDRADGAHTAAPVLAKRDIDSGEIVVVGVGEVVTPEEGGVFTLPWGTGTGSNAIDISQANTQWLMGLYQGGPNGDDAGAVVPFAGGDQYPMFGWNTADLPPEPEEVVAPGHASFDDPALREYQFNFTVSWGGVVNNDLDGDGLPNFYEEANGLNPNDPADAASDSDNDGLTALQEFERKSDPNKADTDGDGLSDKVETGTGIWVSAEDTGTSPTKVDSDRDGLNDNVETNSGTFVSRDNPGTDPNKKDTDGDDWDDSAEIDLGSNPVDQNSDPGDVSGTIVITGEIKEFLGPDDLHLDPSTVVIAVDCYGDDDLDVNGVTFIADKTDTASIGVAEANGVTVTTTAANQIDAWSAGTAFVGADQDSADNLSIVMESIRWAGAPNPITIDVEGLNPSVSYEIQLLVNEGGDRNRRWDIAVEDSLAVDDFTSEGDSNTGVWSGENSFAYVGEFKPSADGILNVIMRQHFGGQPSPGGDNNPILQAVIVHRAGAGDLFEITDITASSEQVVLTWNSLPGRDYAIEFSTDLSNPIWIEVDDGVASEGTTTSFTDDDPARIGLPEGYYRVRN